MKRSVGGLNPEKGREQTGAGDFAADALRGFRELAPRIGEVQMNSVHRENQRRRLDGAETHQRPARQTPKKRTPAAFDSTSQPTHGAASAVDRAVQRIQETADCLSSFAQFLEEAKPEEIRLLGDMLAEWANWSGSLRAGNFFRAVAEGVLSGDVDERLKGWLTDRARLGAAQPQTRRGRSALAAATPPNGAKQVRG